MVIPSLYERQQGVVAFSLSYLFEGGGSLTSAIHAAHVDYRRARKIRAAATPRVHFRAGGGRTARSSRETTRPGSSS